MDGILLIDKPKGWTSFDVVAKVRGLLKKTAAQPANSPRLRVGHSGTLDPLATGLLVILVGSYCKRAAEFTKLAKTYEVEMILGQTSTTGDAEGPKTAANHRQPSLDELNNSLKMFVGAIQQVPPSYSAIKVNGQRAYKLARAGQAVKLKPRPVTINSLEMTSYDYPRVNLIADVSSGTYIRSLVEDIGRQLGVGAYTAELKRTRVGNFELAQASSISDLNTGNISSRLLVI